jgi:hypothetical protein
MIGRRVEKLARKGLARANWEIAQVSENRESQTRNNVASDDCVANRA